MAGFLLTHVTKLILELKVNGYIEGEFKPWEEKINNNDVIIVKQTVYPKGQILPFNLRVFCHGGNVYYIMNDYICLKAENLFDYHWIYDFLRNQNFLNFCSSLDHATNERILLLVTKHDASIYIEIYKPIISNELSHDEFVKNLDAYVTKLNLFSLSKTIKNDVLSYRYVQSPLNLNYMYFVEKLKENTSSDLNSGIKIKFIFSENNFSSNVQVFADDYELFNKFNYCTTKDYIINDVLFGCCDDLLNKTRQGFVNLEMFIICSIVLKTVSGYDKLIKNKILGSSDNEIKLVLTHPNHSFKLYMYICQYPSHTKIYLNSVESFVEIFSSSDIKTVSNYIHNYFDLFKITTSYRNNNEYKSIFAGLDIFKKNYDQVIEELKNSHERKLQNIIFEKYDQVFEELKCVHESKLHNIIFEKYNLVVNELKRRYENNVIKEIKENFTVIDLAQLPSSDKKLLSYIKYEPINKFYTDYQEEIKTRNLVNIVENLYKLSHEDRILTLNLSGI